jgi:hypothetical protein
MLLPALRFPVPHDMDEPADVLPPLARVPTDSSKLVVDLDPPVASEPVVEAAPPAAPRVRLPEVLAALGFQKIR